MGRCLNKAAELMEIMQTLLEQIQNILQIYDIHITGSREVCDEENKSLSKRIRMMCQVTICFLKVLHLENLIADMLTSVSTLDSSCTVRERENDKEEE